MYAHLYFNIKNSQASKELNTSTVLPTSWPLGLHVLHSNEGKGLARSQRRQAKPSPVLWFICGYVWSYLQLDDSLPGKKEVYPTNVVHM